jgi:predicted deacylase
VNILGFAARTRFNPVDYVDLNRIFPDGAGSIITKRIVRAVWELAEQSSYVLDLHCAGLNSYQYILALYKEFPKVKQFTDLIPWDTVVESTGLRGQLFVEATHRGIPSAIIETAGGDGYYNREWGETLLNVVLGTLRALGVLEDGEKPRAVEKRYYGKLVHVESPAEGFPNPVVEPGKDIVKGDVLGYISGKIITSPATGKLIRIAKDVYIFEKEVFASIAPVEEV